MTTTTRTDDLTRRLFEWCDGQPWTRGRGRLLAAPVVELAAGEPVDPERIAARAGVPVAEALDFLRSSPAEWDDRGRLVGFGLSLRETRHRFITAGRTLYTWCGPDALAFPVLLGALARIESPCFATGEPITIDVAPDGVRAVAPAGAVVSIFMRAVQLDDLRERLCNEQHFFVSADAAAAWSKQRPGVTVVPVAEAFEPLRRLMEHWTAGEGA